MLVFDLRYKQINSICMCKNGRAKLSRNGIEKSTRVACWLKIEPGREKSRMTPKDRLFRLTDEQHKI